MQQTITIDCKAFYKNSDGSWTSVQVADINTPTGAIRISPGMIFRKGRTLCGVDVATLLDQNCTQYGDLVVMAGTSNRLSTGLPEQSAN